MKRSRGNWSPRINAFRGWGHMPGWFVGIDWGPLHVHLEKSRPLLPWVRGLVLVATWNGRLRLRQDLTSSTALYGD